jgi:hypothetical protein
MNTPVIYCLRNYFHAKKGIDPRFNNNGPERVLVETEEGKKLATVVASTAEMVELISEDDTKTLANKDSIEMPTFTTLVEHLITLPELGRRRILAAQRRDWDGNAWTFVPGFVIGYRTRVSPEGIPISKVDVVHPDFRKEVTEILQKRFSGEVYFQEKPEQKYLDFAKQQRKKELAKKREKRLAGARKLIKGKMPSEETTQLALPPLKPV